MLLHNLEVGMSKALQKTITEEDTSINYGSRSVRDLLATPALSALMIEASVNLIDPLLPEGYLTVGRVLNIKHTQPTIKSMLVLIDPKIIEIKDNKISLEIFAYDEIGEIGVGYHERYIVRNDFLEDSIKKRTGILSAQP